MELCSVDVLPLNHCRKNAEVVGYTDGVFLKIDLYIVGMHKIKVRMIGDTVKKGASSCLSNLVPAHMGHWPVRGESNHMTPYEPQPRTSKGSSSRATLSR